MLRPPFDPDIARALESRDDIVTALLPHQIEALRARSVPPSDAELTLGGRFAASRHVAPGDAGGVPILLLRPVDATEPVPVVYHVHGGGLVVGRAEDDLPAIAALAASTGAAVASVEYRLAPEHRYPAAVEDVYRGLAWLSAEASTLGLDADAIVIEGISAGGGLAAATALLARDRGGPALRGQMLLCPMLDDRNDSGSARQMVGVGAWDRVANETAWSAYLGAGPRDEVPIYAAPARATDLSGLPPAFIDVGSAETFRDEDVAYASRIWACGGDAELHVWPGGAHGFDALAPDSELALRAREARRRWLKRILGKVTAAA